MNGALNARLNKLCASYGVIWQYVDVNGDPQTAPVETRIALLNALGLQIKTQSDIETELEKYAGFIAWQIVPETVISNPEAATIIEILGVASGSVATRKYSLTLEDGNEISGSSNSGQINLGKLPIGIHDLAIGECNCLIVCAPKTLALPKRGWGVMVPLYGLRSEKKWGIGDFNDLSQSVSQLSPFGISFIGINPVHASFPCDATAYSPYSPSSRRFLNTIHIAPEEMDGWGPRNEIDSSLEPETSGELVDYQNVLKLKTPEFEETYAAEKFDHSAFKVFKTKRGEALLRFATHQSLSQIYGAYWNEWPEEHQAADFSAVKTFRKQNAKSVDFHAWLQWQAHLQLCNCKSVADQNGLANGLYVDLAVGVHPYGAETWADETAFARGVSLGAPADSFSADGQNWGLAPLNPLSLKRTKYKSFIETLQSQLRYAGLLRIDHIIGFERSFWIPQSLPGAYIKMPTDEMMAILRIEAQRSGATIIGEDLGNTPDGFREDLDKNGILGCRVAIFERDWRGDRSFTRPENYTKKALASLATHDLPPFAGWWKGTDIEWRQKLGHISQDECQIQMDKRSEDCLEFENAMLESEKPGKKIKASSIDEDAPPVIRAHAFLAKCNSCLVAVQIEDLLELEQSPNLPGTVFDHPNWRRVLNVDTIKFSNINRLQDVSNVMSESLRGQHQIQNSKAS